MMLVCIFKEFPWLLCEELSLGKQKGKQGDQWRVPSSDAVDQSEMVRALTGVTVMQLLGQLWGIFWSSGTY